MPRNLLSLRDIVIILAATILALAGLSPASGRDAEETVTYQMKAGDTLYDLSRAYMAGSSAMQRVVRLNRIADPRRIPVGTAIQVPVTLLRYQPQQARVAAVRGDVRLFAAGGGTGAPAAQGALLAEGAAVQTGADGFVTLALPDGSRTSIPTRSRVSVVRLRRYLLTDSIDFDLRVDAGKVETRAAPVRNNGQLRVRTPRIVAAVRGTEFRVGSGGADADGAAGDGPDLTEVLEGGVGMATAAGPSTTIGAGRGAVLRPDGRIVEEALLPAPALQDAGKVQVDPQVRLQVQPVAGAAAYHVLVAADSSFLELFAEATSPTPLVMLDAVPNGNHFVKISAIAASGLEGMAQSYAMRRVLTGLSAGAEAGEDGLKFSWDGAGDGVRSYHFQLLNDAAGGLPLVDEPGLVEQSLVLRDLPPGTYRWRVGVLQSAPDGDTSNWLPFEKLTVAAPER